MCNRCGKTLCPECQVEHPVGVICPDCVHDLRPARSSQVKSFGKSKLRAISLAETPVTNTIIALCAVLWVAQLLLPQTTAALWFAPLHATPYAFEPWRMLTSIFVHSPSFLFHILFNMYALYTFGRELERMLGRVYFAALYLLSGLGGSLFVMWWAGVSPSAMLVPTVGASGALFGVIAAIFVVYRKLRVNATSIAVLLGLNLVIGFVPGSNVSWQAHFGGMVFGAVTMLLLFKFGRHQKHRPLVVAALLAVLGVIIVATVVFYTLTPQLVAR
ncbi:rhomboid family intramembrane serine protease [Leucobacter sp. OH2974_COT-288]|nr:rhomboid family intramembrane serine protease [Leucobacter sp. OH2974_COT-288]